MYLKPSTSHGVADARGSDALSSSMLECRLYAKNIFKDRFIGGTKDTIGLLLAEGTAGGLYDSTSSPFR